MSAVSSAVSPQVLAAAETLNLCLPEAPDGKRFVERRWALFINALPGPARNLVQRLRLDPDEVASAVADARALFRAHGRTEVTWELTASTTPPDLADRLLALGMVPDDEPEAAGMVLTHPLPATPTEATVQPVTDPAGFHAYSVILRRCFGRGAPDPTEEETLAEHARRLGHEAHVRRYLAFADGAPIAAAEAIFLDGAVVLGGGGTLPEARGKGAYRALVAARWAAAVERGTPVLVVQAGAMSRPILERLGFETVALVRVLLDRFG